MKKQIKLNSRYGSRNYLNRIGEEDSKRYLLKAEYNYRVGIIEDNPNEYSFVDPSGGPFFISKGSDIDGYKVKSISRGDGGVIIEFE